MAVVLYRLTHLYWVLMSVFTLTVFEDVGCEDLSEALFASNSDLAGSFS